MAIVRACPIYDKISRVVASEKLFSHQNGNCWFSHFFRILNYTDFKGSLKTKSKIVSVIRATPCDSLLAHCGCLETTLDAFIFIGASTKDHACASS